MYSNQLTLERCSNFFMPYPDISACRGNQIRSVNYNQGCNGSCEIRYVYGRSNDGRGYREVRIAATLGEMATRDSVVLIGTRENENIGNYIGENEHMVWDGMEEEINILINDYNIRTTMDNNTNINNGNNSK